MGRESVLPDLTAVAVADGKIAAIGPSDHILAAMPSRARRIDARGLLLVPGFNDCHMHILGYGLKLSAADLSPDAGVRDVPAFVDALRRWAQANPSSAWVRGSGYNQNAFPGAKHVAPADLDRAASDRPLIVHHASGHALLANSRAMALAGVGPATSDPAGGEIGRDASGAPTGVFLESAMSLITEVVPKPSRSDMSDAICRACTALSAVGITSASDMGIESDESVVGAFRDAVERGAALRMTLCPEAVEFGTPEKVPQRQELERDWRLANVPGDVLGSVRLGALKLYADGALTTRTAALREPFADTGTVGMLLHEPDELGAYITTGHDRGWQMAVHAIGDRAIEAVAEACESLDDASGRRHRIEHCMLLDADLIGRIRRAGIVAVIQPEFVARLGDAYVLGLGLERAATLNPVASLLRAGVPAAFSSDCPVVPGAPLDGIRAAMSRRTPSGIVLGDAERITAAEAIRAYTEGAAYAVCDEKATGTLAQGMRADFALLTDLPTETDTSVVAATVCGGKVVYGAEHLA